MLFRSTLRLLAHLAEERGFAEWREALLAGKPVNNTENRAAWHTELRSGRNAEALQTLGRMKDIVSKIRSGKTFRRIVNLAPPPIGVGPPPAT